MVVLLDVKCGVGTVYGTFQIVNARQTLVEVFRGKSRLGKTTAQLATSRSRQVTGVKAAHRTTIAATQL